MAQSDTCIIGSGLSVKGSVRGDAPLTVRGVVEGSVQLGGELRVEAGGRVEADVEATRVVVEGSLTGDILAREAIVIEAGATVIGNLQTPRLAIAEGAHFRGRVEMEFDLPEAPAESN